MKKEVVVGLSVCIVLVLSITALCTTGSVGLADEESSEEVFEGEFSIKDIGAGQPGISKADELIEIEISEDDEVLFEDVCRIIDSEDLNAADEASLKNAFISAAFDYSMTNDEMGYIKNLFQEGYDMEKVVEIYEFLRWTNKDYSFIEAIYDAGIEKSDEENWIYDAYDKFFEREDDMLSVEDVAYYVDMGIGLDEIAGAYELSFSGEKTTKAMLGERIEGKKWNEIAASSLSETPQAVINAPEMSIDEVMMFKNVSVRQRKDFSEIAVVTGDRVVLNEGTAMEEERIAEEKTRLLTGIRTENTRGTDYAVREDFDVELIEAGEENMEIEEEAAE